MPIKKTVSRINTRNKRRAAYKLFKNPMVFIVILNMNWLDSCTRAMGMRPNEG